MDVVFKDAVPDWKRMRFSVAVLAAAFHAADPRSRRAMATKARSKLTTDRLSIGRPRSARSARSRAWPANRRRSKAGISVRVDSGTREGCVIANSVYSFIRRLLLPVATGLCFSVGQVEFPATHLPRRSRTLLRGLTPTHTRFTHLITFSIALRMFRPVGGDGT